MRGEHRGVFEEAIWLALSLFLSFRKKYSTGREALSSLNRPFAALLSGIRPRGKKNPPVTRYHIHFNILSSREFVGKIRIPALYSGSKLARPFLEPRGFVWKIQTRILPTKTNVSITFLLREKHSFPELRSSS